MHRAPQIPNAKEVEKKTEAKENNVNNNSNTEKQQVSQLSQTKTSVLEHQSQQLQQQDQKEKNNRNNVAASLDNLTPVATSAPTLTSSALVSVQKEVELLKKELASERQAKVSFQKQFEEHRKISDNRIKMLEDQHQQDLAALKSVGEQIQDSYKQKNEALKKVNELDQKVKKYKRKRKRDKTELEELKKKLEDIKKQQQQQQQQQQQPQNDNNHPSTMDKQGSFFSKSKSKNLNADAYSAEIENLKSKLKEEQRVAQKAAEEYQKDKIALNEQIAVLKEEIQNLEDANKLQVRKNRNRCCCCCRVVERRDENEEKIWNDTCQKSI